MREKQIITKKLAETIRFKNCVLNYDDLNSDTYVYKGSIVELTADIRYYNHEPMPPEEKALCRNISEDTQSFYVQCYKIINNPLL